MHGHVEGLQTEHGAHVEADAAVVDGDHDAGGRRERRAHDHGAHENRARVDAEQRHHAEVLRAGAPRAPDAVIADDDAETAGKQERDERGPVLG